MADPFTEAWAEGNASVPKNKVNLDCLEFMHPSFIEDGELVSVRVVRDTQDREFLLEADAPMDPSAVVLFKGIPFDMPTPEVADGQTPTMSIKVDNIGREIAQYLDEAVKIRSELRVRARCYIWDAETGLSEQGTQPFTFVLRSVTVGDESVEGAASPADLVNLQVCRLVYDLVNYPGLNSV